MWHRRLIRHGWLLPAALLALAAPAPAQAPDPVEDLRLALPFPIGDERKPEALEYREKTLKARIDALKTLGDLRRALALTEWKDKGTGPPGPLQKIDLAARTEVGTRFQRGVDHIVKTGSPDAKLAVAAMLGELGASVRALAPADNSGFGRSLAPSLIELTHDANPDVRSAAARALGKVNPAPKAAVDALQALLAKDGLPQRRAAAEGLLNMIQVAAQIVKKGSTRFGVEASSKDIVEIGSEVVRGGGGALKDKDTEVRRLALEALLQSGISFSELIRVPYPATEFPPLERKLTPAEVAHIQKETEVLRSIYEEWTPLMTAFRDVGPAIAATLGDPDIRVRILSRRSLEMIGYSRVRIRRLIVSVPVLAAEGQKEPPVSPLLKDDPLAKALEAGVRAIAGRARDPNVLVRRAAVDFLETLLDGAAPAIPTLVEALGDSDRFVRWSAARTLMRIGPVKTELTVPALAHVASDQDTDVAIMAAATLERYGPAAKAGVRGLLRAAGPDADPDVRAAMFRALASIGDPAAVATLAAAVGDAEVRVRRAAATSLASFGPQGRPAEAALRRALFDDDAEVRQNAGEALLSILRNGK